MRNYTKRLSVLLVAAVVTLLHSCSTEDIAGNIPAPNPNIAQIIAQDPNFSVLNAAVNRAGLSAALAGNNITLFAPNNVAFRAAGYPDAASINNIPVPTLQSILTYHVVGRQIPASSIPVSDTFKTVNLQNLYASKNANGSFINGFKVAVADKKGSDGYIHEMGSVLFPPAANKSIASVIADDTTFSILLAAVSRAGLLAFFNDPNKLTVFAPNNAAFRTSGITDVNAVPVSVLTTILRSHVIPTNVFSAALINNTDVITAQPGTKVTVTTIPTATVKIMGSTRPVSVIIAKDNICANGVIHVINRVLLQ